MNAARPYLTQPFLIPQPTWGGTYIAQKKGWNDRSDIDGLKIGQSYELFGKTRVYETVTNTADPLFSPLIKNAALQNIDGTLSIDDVISSDPSGFLGKSVSSRFKAIPILIKFTQARGNSFQLHIAHGKTSTKWKPKAECWYYLEKGTCTYGLAPGTDVKHYHESCVSIDSFMQELSLKVKTGSMSLKDAKSQAVDKIRSNNPWQYVNIVHTKPGDFIDLSSGGIHHSWEDDPDYPQGNILYEIQEDVSDEDSTLRSFDQGKLLDDGSIRSLTIDDYFTHIDTSPALNDPGSVTKNCTEGTLVSNEYYSIETHALPVKTTCATQDSFRHIFVSNGILTLRSNETVFTVGSGHSIVLPSSLGEYELNPLQENTSYITSECLFKKGVSI